MCDRRAGRTAGASRAGDFVNERQTRPLGAPLSDASRASCAGMSRKKKTSGNFAAIALIYSKPDALLPPGRYIGKIEHPSLITKSRRLIKDLPTFTEIW